MSDAARDLREIIERWLRWVKQTLRRFICHPRTVDDQEDLGPSQLQTKALH